MKLDRETLSYIFAAVALLVGFGLTIAGFCVSPTGEVHDSVLFLLGQCLVFAGAVCGISLHVNNTMKRMKQELTGSRDTDTYTENKKIC